MHNEKIVMCEFEDLVEILWSPGKENLSLGSLKHKNVCKPCIFWIKGRCKAGIFCTFCHVEHTRYEKVNRSKRRRRAQAEQEHATDAKAVPQIYMCAKLGDMCKLA